MAQKPMLRAEDGMRVRCANKASADQEVWVWSESASPIAIWPLQYECRIR